MASRRLFSSLLRSSLTRSLSEFQSPTYLRQISFSTVTMSPQTNVCSRVESANGLTRLPSYQHGSVLVPHFRSRFMSTETNSVDSSEDSSLPEPELPPRIKFKRLDKTARHIMQILDKEAVEEVKGQREVPDIKPGYIVQLKVEVPENKRRVSIIKGIVIARRNCGLHTTFRLRRMVAGVGIESLFPLYSPNIKEIKVLDKKKVRRAKLYYLRDKMNALK
ncbi:putative ribosomal protein L19 [Medicago truncatula]|uniref:50S ribosomal protein L19-2 n=1 Tax=Medicago truncatula TaxID=3880 RepID=A0A072V7A1_MEDTR|nr:50S ribosomal protein L19, chloroplastic [Medicago truncatula]KEH34045.1 50S ribosomal protein L19-2 [Medicago truncatula]RHN67373.1 putative ribosomal protein L19 [Medicago truncatula]